MTQVSVRQNEGRPQDLGLGGHHRHTDDDYGMSFEHMPELGWRFGYPLPLGVIAVSCFALYRYFRRVGWL